MFYFLLITFLSPFISCTTTMKHRTGECGLMLLRRKNTAMHLFKQRLFILICRNKH